MNPVKVREHAEYGEPDRASVTANGIVVDVIANDDGTVYVEAYPYQQGKSPSGRQQVVVRHAALDAYSNPTPSLTLRLQPLRAGYLNPDPS